MQDNGELQEDVVSKATLEGGGLDAELRDTFPASDPGRSTVNRPMRSLSGTDPGAPLPRTLPKDVPPG